MTTFFLILVGVSIGFAVIMLLINNYLNDKDQKTLSEYYKEKAKAYNELITQKESINDIQRTRNISSFNKKSETTSKE